MIGPGRPDSAGTSSEPVATRVAYRDHLRLMMAQQSRILCLDTDTGLFSGNAFDGAPGRYIDFGIAEHTVLGAAAALASAGWTPFVNTMATFASTRALEVVKIDIAHNGLPVRIVGTHGGVAAAHLGPTHWALEDLAVMRALPGMTVVVPADAGATVRALEDAAGLPGPLYLRLGRKATPPLPVQAPAPVIGRIQPLRDAGAVVIVACGPYPVLAALAAAEELAAQGIPTGVLNAHTVEPMDGPTLLEHTRDAALVVTVEEHRPAGGLGGAVAEVLGAHAPRRLLRIGLGDSVRAGAGGHEQILELHGLTGPGVARRVRAALEDVPDPLPVSVPQAPVPTSDPTIELLLRSP